MAWENPKTDWKAGDAPSSGDFNRIEKNIDYVSKNAGKVESVNNVFPDSNRNVDLKPADIGAVPKGTNDIIIGNNAQITFPENGVSIGKNSRASYNSVSIGESTNTDSNSVAIGGNVGTGRWSVAIGNNFMSENQSVGIGYELGNVGFMGVGIGWMASTGGRGVSIGHGAIGVPRTVSLGSKSISNNENEGVLGVPPTVNDGASKWKIPGSLDVSGTKNFEIPHPKPEKTATHVIRHGAVESPTAGDTLYRYRVTATKENDLVTIDLPDYFVWLNKDVQVFVTPQAHFGNGYGELNRETEQLEIHCQFKGKYNVLVIGTRNDNHPSVQDWNIKGVEREVGESWTGETYTFEVEEIMEVEEIKEEAV